MVTNRMTRAFLLAALLAAAGLGGWILGAGEGAGEASPALTMGVDADPSGNTATSLGAIDDCREVSTGDTFHLDIYITHVAHLWAWQSYFVYEPSVISVIDRNVDMFLAANARSIVVDLSGPVPDSDGQYVVAAGDIADPPTDDSGSGVLVRLTLKAVGPGLSSASLPREDEIGEGWGPTLMNLDGEALGDDDGDGFFDGPILHAQIAVDRACAPDEDKDGWPDEADNCPDISNSGQEDGEGDGVGDVCDNCPTTYDPGNEDNDGDGVPGTQPPPGATWGGDACDEDDDNDFMPDTYEQAHACLDPFVADHMQNADGDELINYAEMIVATNPCLTEPELAEDSDSDGFSDGKEMYMGADPLDSCPDDLSDHAWPPDWNNDTAVDILDIVRVIHHFPSTVGWAQYDRARDLNADGAVDILDIVRVISFFPSLCTNP